MAIQRRSWKVHANFQCQDCDWEDQDWQHATKNALRHAQRNNHEVFGETGYAVRYERKGEP